jgi:hypothetical protein
VHSRSPAAEAEGPHPPRAPAPMAAPLPGLCDGPLGPGTSPAP